MANSGRINRRWAILVKTGFLPLVTIDRKGKGTVTGMAFSQRETKRFCLPGCAAPGWRYCVGTHRPLTRPGACRKTYRYVGKTARLYRGKFRGRHNFSGPGSLAVACWTKNRRQPGIIVGSGYARFQQTPQNAQGGLALNIWLWPWDLLTCYCHLMVGTLKQKHDVIDVVWGTGLSFRRFVLLPGAHGNTFRG
jgi:hypothetical protein